MPCRLALRLLGRQAFEPGTAPSLAPDSNGSGRAAGYEVSSNLAVGRENSMEHNDSGFLDTRRAADYLSLSRRTLDGYRVTGGGPVFHRFGNRVRYRLVDLDTWAASRRATTTAEAGKLGLP